MKRKRLTAVLSAVVMVLGLAVAVVAWPAHADDNPIGAQAQEHDYAVPTNYGSQKKDCVLLTYVNGCVQPYGDYLMLRDRRVDGHPVKLWWMDDDGPRSGYCENNKGVDAGWTYCNKDFPEGHTIVWSVEYHDGSGKKVHTDWFRTVV